MDVYQAYQSVGYGWYGCLYPYPYPTPCILTRPFLEPGYFAAGVPNIPRYRVRVWMLYRTYQRVGYGCGCGTKLTKGSGTGMDVVPSLPKCRVRVVWMLVPVPIPDTLYFNKTVPGTRVFCCGRTELTKVSGTGMDVVPNLPKSRVRVWMSCQAYQRVGYGTAACTRTRTQPRVLQQGRTRYQGILPLAYRTYQSVGYGYGRCTKLTKVSGTGKTRSRYPWNTLIGTLPHTP